MALTSTTPITRSDLTKSAGDFGDVTLSLSDTDIDNDDMKFFVSWAKTF